MVFDTELDLSDAERELREVSLDLDIDKDLVDTYEDEIPDRLKRPRRRQRKRAKTRALKGVSNAARKKLIAEQSAERRAAMLKLLRLKEEIVELRSRKKTLKQHLARMRAAKRKLKNRICVHGLKKPMSPVFKVVTKPSFTGVRLVRGAGRVVRRNHIDDEAEGKGQAELSGSESDGNDSNVSDLINDEVEERQQSLSEYIAFNRAPATYEESVQEHLSYFHPTPNPSHIEDRLPKAATAAQLAKQKKYGLVEEDTTL
ncbi:hypothetical protein OC846_006306 [Tilletia horrida]|uniref:Uncharacterized protein n=1 Tax=Tilletia horrida TaxID=155126 RepID=A0AAN6GLW3_9BASI|nr:hypothetical protein OC846_006306 [Tilletia horrida]